MRATRRGPRHRRGQCFLWKPSDAASVQHSSRRRRDLLLFSQLRLLKDVRFLTTECLSYVSGGQQLGAGVHRSQRALSCSASFDDPGILNQTMSVTLFFLIADVSLRIGFSSHLFYSKDQ